MNHLFTDLVVIELANVLAGPSVGQFMAELGATVIKVENPKTRGDVTRSWKLASEAAKNSVSAYFSAANSGKKSIALDLSNPEDFDILSKLLAKADMVLASYKKGDAEKLRVDYLSLQKINPQLIYGQITGYGDEEERVGYDAVIQAESGFMFMNGEAGGNSLKMPVALIDVLAAHHLKEALLLAYIHRLQKQEGAFVSVSLFDAAICSLANQATNFLIANHDPQKMGAEHPNIAPYGSIIRSADDQEILLAVGSDTQFVSLCRVLEIPELTNDPRFQTNSQRVENRNPLNEFLKEAARKIEANELMKIFQKAQVPAGKLQSVGKVFKENKTADQMIFKPHQKATGLRNFSGHLSFMEKISHLPPPPELDQHRAEILAFINK